MSKNELNPVDIEKIDEQLDKTETVEKISDEVPFDQIIENKRLELYEMYKKNKIRSNIIMLITVVLVIACFIMISQKNQVLNIIGYSIAGAVIVGMIVYYILTRKKFPDATKDYIKLVTTTLNSYNYRATEFSDVTNDVEEKVELANIIADGIYERANQISSRNVVHGKYMSHSFTAADVALYSGSGKNRQTDFVGKYITIGNDLKFNGKIVIVKKLEENSVDLPTNLEDVELVLEEGQFAIYSSPAIKDEVVSILGKNYVEMIKNLVLDTTLLNINVVVWAGNTAYYLSYSDGVISLPFEKPFDGKDIKIFEEQQRTLMHGSMEHFN